MIALRRTTPEVWYTVEAGASIGPEEIAFLVERASASRRLRARICLHRDPAAPVHEMIIVHHASCYVRPHRHPHKAESLTALAGAASALFFAPDGSVAERVALAPADGGATVLHVAPNRWHGLLIESEWFVFYEVAAGPFTPDASEFPPWAPADDADGSFVGRLRGEPVPS